MKKECAYTRKALPNYLRGHLFKLEQLRVERHLRSCVVCYSQYESLKHADETRKFLKDITPPEGVVQIVKDGVSGLGKLKTILYRPLWILGILVVLGAVYYFVTKPRQLDLEIDRIVQTAPSHTVQPSPVVSPQPAARPAAPVPAITESVAPVIEPLIVTITTSDDKTTIRRINEIMRGHGQLRKFKLTDTVREISGNLTVKELRTFFNRIESTGKVSYNRKRFEALPNVQPIPFVMKLIVVPRPPEEKTTQEQGLRKPADVERSQATVSAPTPSVAQ
jgi:hypothetical protein